MGEVFAAALASSSRYRPQHESAAPWLLGIAGNKLRESRRKGRVQDATPALAAVEDLPAPERDAVRARVIEERDYREIATELRCSESVAGPAIAGPAASGVPLARLLSSYAILRRPRTPADSAWRPPHDATPPIVPRLTRLARRLPNADRVFSGRT